MAQCGTNMAFEIKHSRRVRMSPKHRHRFARLHDQGLVVLQTLQSGHDRFIALPGAGRLAGASIDDQILRLLGHFRVEIVHQHAHGGFLLPALAGELCPPWAREWSVLWWSWQALPPFTRGLE